MYSIANTYALEVRIIFHYLHFLLAHYLFDLVIEYLTVFKSLFWVNLLGYLSI